MNLKKNSSINDSVLITWILQNLKRERKEFNKSTDENDQVNHLVLLAKALRELVNATRSKQGGIQQQWKKEVNEWIQWLQKELLKREYTTKNTSILKAIQYGIKHCGNIAIEGRAIGRPVTASERKRLERLTREAEKRALSSLEHLNPQDSDDSADDSGSDL